MYIRWHGFEDFVYSRRLVLLIALRTTAGGVFFRCFCEAMKCWLALVVLGRASGQDPHGKRVQGLNPWNGVSLTDDGGASGIRRIVLSDGSRDHIIERILQQKKAWGKHRFTVLDIGPVANPWSIHMGVADAIFDLYTRDVTDCWGREDPAKIVTQCCQSAMSGCWDTYFTQQRCCDHNNTGRPHLIRFTGDVTDAKDWEKLLAYVKILGKFDFVITSHILEDVIHPAAMVEMLPRVAKAGYVSVPSKYFELTRYTHSPEAVHIPRMRGAIHHRWIFTVRKGVLLAIPKLPIVEVPYSQIAYRC
ncbi:unnamed protein product [Polarella glacialis]|uniref:Uncharacterized protein n=1 Tax=Polarella glacialis TaxID=89957 RepID=A0A813HCX3_POLGL|nr:unnamed protein product [Polarella glacialis]